MTTAAASAVWLVVLPAIVSAQILRGDIVDAGSGAPIGGAFVVLLDEAGMRVGAVLSHDDGTYIIRAPAPGRYRVRVERIGHGSTHSPFVVLAAGATVVQRIEVRPQPIRIDAIDAPGEDRCRLSREAGLQAQALWEEARKALSIAAWLESDGALPYQTVVYQRSRDLVTDRVLTVDTHARELHSGIGKAPFHSVGAADLAADGYIRRLAGGEYRYFGLDAATLLSDAFLDNHCMRVVRSRDAGSDRVGLQFEPLPGRTAPDVAGVLWLDARTFELQRVDFTFTRHLHVVELPQAAFGGSAEFRRLGNGAWVVDRWRLRMPQVVETAVAPPSALQPTRAAVTDHEQRLAARLAGIAVREEGGDVAFVAAPAHGSGDGVIEGIVYDSTRHRVLAGATVFLTTTQQSTRTDAHGRFRLTGLSAGGHDIAFFHPYTDSIALRLRAVRATAHAGGDVATDAIVHLSVPAAASCEVDTGAPADSPPTAGVLGFVVDPATGAPAAGVPVSAWWDVRSTMWSLWDALRRISPHQRQTADGISDANGRYVICGLPVAVPLRLSAGRGTTVSLTATRAAVHKLDLLTR